MNDPRTLSRRADALEEKMSRDLDLIVIKSRLRSMAEGDMSPSPNANAIMARDPDARVLMGDHKWHMSGRTITVHDIYSFDPDVVVEPEECTDVIGRAFRQPEQGLGFDNSPVAHMWRAMIRPAKYL